MALANRKLARAGGDPLAARRRTEGMPSFEEASEKVVAIHSGGWKDGGKSAKQWRASLSECAYQRTGDNVSAWVRRQLRAALEREFPAPAPKPPSPSQAKRRPAPKPRHPTRRPSRAESPGGFPAGSGVPVSMAQESPGSPTTTRLPGAMIGVTDSKGDSWNTTILRGGRQNRDQHPRQDVQPAEPLTVRESGGGLAGPQRQE